MFSQVPQAQAALVSLDPEDGSIEALAGGFSFGQSNYNRAIQAKRQPVPASSRSFIAPRWTPVIPRRAWSTTRPSSSSSRAWTASGGRRTITTHSWGRSACAKRCTSPGTGVDSAAANHGGRLHDQLHHPLRLQRAGPAAQSFLALARQRSRQWRSPPAGPPSPTAATRSSPT